MTKRPDDVQDRIKRHAAVQAGNDKYIAECAARPIDDAAWKNELEQRAGIERC